MKFNNRAAYFAGLLFAVGLQLIGSQRLVSTNGAVLEELSQTSEASPHASRDSKTGLIPVATSATVKKAETKFVGTSACVHCHKNGHEFPNHAVAGKEFSIWVNRDPHSCAYNILYLPKSLEIAKHLKLKTPPHKNELCLNCHSTNVAPEQLTANHQHNPNDGVGCESCHGGAERWLVPHKLPEWQSLSASQKSSLGFVNTDDLATRTRKCAECHIGSDGRDVNHDLIAAGHPRRYFEMAAYQSRMVRHWSRSKELQQHGATAEARLWLIGQFASAAVQLELLQQRASDDQAPWPEFAEYGCFSCHHDLAHQRPENKNPFRGLAATPEWGTWHFATIPDIGQSIGSLNCGDGFELASNARQFSVAMQTEIPNRNTVKELAGKLQSELNQIADRLSATPLSEAMVRDIASRFFAAEFSIDEVNWDALTQRYLAAVALRQSLLDSNLRDGMSSESDWEFSRQQLLKIRDSLKFIEDHDGPRELTSEENQEIFQGFAKLFGQAQ